MSFYHFRDRDGVEVDIVMERGAGMLAGSEVKAAASVTDSDFRGLLLCYVEHHDKAYDWAERRRQVRTNLPWRTAGR